MVPPNRSLTRFRFPSNFTGTRTQRRPIWLTILLRSLDADTDQNNVCSLGTQHGRTLRTRGFPGIGANATARVVQRYM